VKVYIFKNERLTLLSVFCTQAKVLPEEPSPAPRSDSTNRPYLAMAEEIY